MDGMLIPIIRITEKILVGNPMTSKIIPAILSTAFFVSLAIKITIFKSVTLIQFQNIKGLTFLSKFIKMK